MEAKISAKADHLYPYWFAFFSALISHIFLEGRRGAVRRILLHLGHIADRRIPKATGPLHKHPTSRGISARLLRRLASYPITVASAHVCVGHPPQQYLIFDASWITRMPEDCSDIRPGDSLTRRNTAT